VPVILVSEAYWRQAFNIDFLIDEGVVDPEDRELFWYAETAEDIWQGILDWHKVNGIPLF
jgi:predicted Rossmann-fold nucleotide-binding protein